jgi:hypothetical protein
MQIDGINLNIEGQLELLEKFEKHYKVLPFENKKKQGLRYYYENDWYSYCDAIFLSCVLMEFKPKKIIEVGSGFSSAVTLDINEIFLESKLKTTFIEPDPNRLLSLMSSEDKENSTMIKRWVESVDTKIFEELEENDILFIDSSHILSHRNDLNYLMFKILPNLKKGVLIHFHDIFYPFEYSIEAINAKIPWNEVYFLRAFLTFNHQFEIKLFSHFLTKYFPEKFKNMEKCLLNPGGNIWIQKT